MNENRSGEAGRQRSRRSLLRLGGAVGLCTLAGCTEDVGSEFPPNEHWPVSEYLPSLPVSERNGMMADRVEEMATADIDSPDAFAGAFEEYDFEIESIERDRDVLTVEYVDDEAYRTGSIQHIGSLAGGYAALVESGFDAVSLGITILDSAPSSYGTATVETSWAERFNAGGYSAEEFAELVATTVESKRRPPDVEVSEDE